MLAADEDFYNKFGEPLFGSHMLDLSEEPDEENIAICVEYFKRMAPMKIWLEMEIGITGGEEDGVNNEDVDPEKLYTSPEQVYAVYEALSKIGDFFSIAAAFGNVHGVYKPGNVVLSPERLGKHQEYTKKMINSSLAKPIYLVMHGGSGSTDSEIMTAVENGVVKMNIDTDSKCSLLEKNVANTHLPLTFSFQSQLNGHIGMAFAFSKKKSVTTSRARLETPPALTSPTRSSTIPVSGFERPKRA